MTIDKTKIYVKIVNVDGCKIWKNMFTTIWNLKIFLNSINIEKIIKDGLQKEYNQNLKLNHISNIKQILLLLIGIIFLIIWATIKVENIWKEVLLIIGWVPIWEAVDIKLFADMESKRRRTILKKLITSEIIIKSINLK